MPLQPTPAILTKSKLFFAVILNVFVFLFGTLGFMAIEKWDAFDSFYMTVITVATIGYKEIHDLSRLGQVFNIILIFLGLGVIAYTVNVAIRIILEGEIQEIMGRRKMEKKIKGLKDHYILCGYGRMGRVIYRELRQQGLSLVVVDRDVPELVTDEQFLAVQGDATRDETLRSAGLDRAKGLITALSTDAENLFVVLSARVLNPGIHIVCRAEDERTEQKLILAGANRVVCPYRIGGLKLAHSILRPSVVDFIEFATMSGNIELQMEEIKVEHSSRIAGKMLSETGIGRDLGIIIVAIKKSSEDMKFNPTHKTVIEAGDLLIAFGETGKLKELEKMAKDG